MAKTRSQPAMSLPPQAGHHCACDVRQRVARITDCMRHEFGTDPFKAQRPEHQMKRDFGHFWWNILRAQTELAMEPKHRRQCAGNQPAVIKVGMQESSMYVR